MRKINSKVNSKKSKNLIHNKMVSTTVSHEESYSSALYLRSIHVFPHVFATSMQLGLLDIIASAGGSAAGSGAHLTASEITAQLATQNPLATSMVDRILKLLTCYNLLTCSLHTLENGAVERRYGVSPTGLFFVKKKDGASLNAIYDKYISEAWFQLKDAILEGGNPFEKAHGLSAYQNMNAKPENLKGFIKAMDNLCFYTMKTVLEIYNGFQGLTCLVDVGGGSGLALSMIISKYPEIKAINFDLPSVVQAAPSHPGVEHLGGDMFISIPSAGAIMLKEILHNWDDEQCIKILKNCYDALPKEGKVIVVSHIMPEVLDQSIGTKYVCHLDAMMFMYPGGKQRTEKEFQTLSKAAGFSGFQLICLASHDPVGVMEFYK